MLLNYGDGGVHSHGLRTCTWQLHSGSKPPYSGHHALVVMPPDQLRIRVLLWSAMEAARGNSFPVVLQCSRKPKIEEMDVVDAVLGEGSKSAAEKPRGLKTE
jgi:hypothetical protein